MQYSRIGRALFAGALAAVAVLALLPQTGWIVRLQLRGGVASTHLMQTLSGTSAPVAGNKAQVQALVRARPTDFALQLAAVLRQEIVPEAYQETDPPENKFGYRRAQRVWQLRAAFPNEPALYATYLRLSCIQSGVGRDVEQEVMMGGTRGDAQARINKRLNGKPSPDSYWETHPQWVATLADAAWQGERLDPGNAYFPFMLALCEFSAKRDTSALAALNRAATGTRFDGYLLTETEGLLALSRAEYGPTGAIAQTAIVASQLFPDMAIMRAAARIAIAQAILKEQSGDAEGGFQVRRSLSRVGALMRRDGNSLITSLVGMAIVQMSAARPGGALPNRDLEGYAGKNGDERARLSQARYRRYLAEIGHADEALWFAEETRRTDRVRSITRRGLGRSIYGGLPLLWVGIWWGVCFALLVTTFWMLLGGGIAALVARGARVRDAAPLHVAARYALGAVFAAPVAALATFAVMGTFGGEGGATPALVASLLLCAPLFFLVRNPMGTGREFTRAQRHIEIKRSAKIYGKVLALTLATAALIGVTFLAVFSDAQQSMFMLRGISDSETNSNVSFPRAGVFLAGVVAFSLLGIVLTLIISLVWSLKRKVPASVGLALGFRNAALPVAALWLLLYAGAVVQTSRVEAQASREVQKSRQHEGRYLAALLNEAWPDLVPEPTKGE